MANLAFHRINNKTTTSNGLKNFSRKCHWNMHQCLLCLIYMLHRIVLCFCLFSWLRNYIISLVFLIKTHIQLPSANIYREDPARETLKHWSCSIVLLTCTISSSSFTLLMNLLTMKWKKWKTKECTNPYPWINFNSISTTNTKCSTLRLRNI